MHSVRFVRLLGLVLLTAAVNSYAANFSLAPTAGTPPSPALAGATNVTYTFATKTKGNKNTAIPLNAAVTVTFPAGTDASTIDQTNSTFSGTKITSYTSITPTVIQFRAPVAVVKNKAFSLQLFNIKNPSTAGSVSTTVVITNVTGGKDTCKFLYTIAVGTPAKLAFKTQPSTTANGVSIFPAVQVVIQDTAGNTVPTATDNISIAIGANPSSGTLSPTNPVVVKAVNGVATFTNMSINNPGIGYTLIASDAPLPTVTSNAFNIFFSTANRLIFGQEPPLSPATVTAGTVIAPALTVMVKDSNNNTVNTSLAITLSLGNNAGGGTLSGTTTVNAVNGVATFSDLSIDKAGAGYTLAATSAGPFSTTSTPFTVVAASPTQLAFVVQPTDTGAGSFSQPSPITPSIQVALEDAFGNICTGVTGTVTSRSLPIPAAARCRVTTSPPASTRPPALPL